MTDAEARELFQSLRWKDNDGQPVCPRCDNTEKHYQMKTRNLWKCAECAKQFSVTSGTVFAYHKLPLQDYLAAIAIFTNGAKGVSALQMSRDLNVQYKTAFVMLHKVRESIMNGSDIEKLSGKVEMDGAYFNKHVRPANQKENRIDRRRVENQNPKKRCVFTIRERGTEGQGAKKTRTFVIKSENTVDINRLVQAHVKQDATLYADEFKSYNELSNYFAEVKRVNHSLHYSDPVTKACTNQAESFFSRMCRGFIGQHHRMSVKCLDSYASEMTYREDMRREDNGFMFRDITTFCGALVNASQFVGYWQRRK